MKYGFVIDNRKCIGCHACTTACKSEHEVAIGVNRTWVKYIEKGEFPNTRRLFSVMRCNHCTDAPCVTICPVEALFTRPDGIVDFNNDRCIGCKSCMQACPYDALYIDPDTNTAAKCNYCAHKIELNMEPACVKVCPEHAIISGDMHDPNSEISQLLAGQQVQVRKPEKNTQPNLFYIGADEASLNPTATEKTGSYLWSNQKLGVGHYAKEAEKMAFSNGDVIAELLKTKSISQPISRKKKSIKDVLKKGNVIRAFDAPDKGILWGWEVSGYVWTKAISSGAFIVPLIAWLFDVHVNIETWWASIILGLIFLTFTGILLIKDLDRPDRFLNVLLRPQKNSWLVRGGYAISLYGLLLSILGAAFWFGWDQIIPFLMVLTGLVAVFVAIYTAYLFAQAKARDFWQSPVLPLHMIIHSILAGVAILLICHSWLGYSLAAKSLFNTILLAGLGLNLLVILAEITIPHPTADAKITVTSITKGRYAYQFWIGVISMGIIIPFTILWFGTSNFMNIVASTLTLVGIYLSNHIWIEAPQRIQLS